MMWNWQLKDWPGFVFESSLFADAEGVFMRLSGQAGAYLTHISKEEMDLFKVEMLSLEGLESSKIEGEQLDRESLQSSIRRHFGLNPLLKKENSKEAGMAEALIDLYKTYKDPLDHSTLFRWHKCIFLDTQSLSEIGCYRTHEEPMQIVSNQFGSDKVYFEAPPSKNIKEEMDKFVKWYNNFKGLVLVKAAVAHVYFESIHPFEDGNGRIGRLIVEKILSQGLRQPSLIAVSKSLETAKKEYYTQLEKCNHTLEINNWIEFFISKILEAQKLSFDLLKFLICKSKILSKLSLILNERQLKALFRLFKEGPKGFTGGLSAENYISITKASRATATRDLNDLVEKGALVKQGELKHTRYYLNLDFF